VGLRPDVAVIASLSHWFPTYRACVLLGSWQFELEGQFRQAEQHYSKTRDWQACVSMYRAQNMVEDMLRVAKSLGGLPAWHEVAYAYAQGLGGDQMLKFVEKLGTKPSPASGLLHRHQL